MVYGDWTSNSLVRDCPATVTALEPIVTLDALNVMIATKTLLPAVMFDG